MSSTTETTATPTTSSASATTTATTAAASVQNNSYGIFVLIIIALFVIVTIYCLIKSLMCFSKSGSTTEKIFGVVIAFFTGPFYLLYLNFNEGYCNDNTETPQQPMIGGRRKKQ